MIWHVHISGLKIISETWPVMLNCQRDFCLPFLICQFLLIFIGALKVFKILCYTVTLAENCNQSHTTCGALTSACVTVSQSILKTKIQSKTRFTSANVTVSQSILKTKVLSEYHVWFFSFR